VTDTQTRPDPHQAAPPRGRSLPLRIGLVVYAAALPLWGISAAAGPGPAWIVILLAAVPAALIVRSRTDAGRRPALAAVAAAAIWLGLFAAFGWSWLLSALWATAVGAFFPAWRRHLQTLAPAVEHTEPTFPPELVTAAAVIDRWVAHVANDGPLKGTRLELATTDGVVHKFRVRFIPGKHTYAQVASHAPQITSAMDVPEANVIIEKGRTAGYARLTVITDASDRSPVMYPGPSFDPETGLLCIGEYDDDRGKVYLSIVAANGVFGALFCGDQGSGKSACMEQAGLSLLASGYFTGLYVDPQGGMSSPALAEACKWTARNVAEAAELVRALPRWRRLRQIIFGRNKQNGYTLSKEHPALIVFMDEFHELATGFSKADQDTLMDMSKTLRKVGGLLMVGTQNVGLRAFGGNNDLRTQLMSRNVVYFYTSSKQQGNLSGSNEFDPHTLPSGTPGYGYVKEVKVDGKLITRAAPIRAYHLGDKADFGGLNPGVAWLRHLRQTCTFADLPRAEAGAFGAAFAHRDQTRAEADAAAEAFLTACEAVGRGELDPEALTNFDPDAKPKPTKEPAAAGGGLPSLRLGGPEEATAGPGGEEYPDAKKTQAVLNALRAGAWRTAEIIPHAARYNVEVSTSLIEQRLRQFVAEGQAVRVETGHYHAIGYETNCGHPRCRG
jgi:hypothetical protein